MGMKIKQFFCPHKQIHKVRREYLQSLFGCSINDIYNIYECNECGKEFKEVVEDGNDKNI